MNQSQITSLELAVKEGAYQPKPNHKLLDLMDLAEAGPKIFKNPNNKGAKAVPIQNRFWNKVVKTDSCWLWKGGINPSGYGTTSIFRIPVMAHRVAWVLIKKTEIPEGMTIDHLCKNRTCVNPAHMEIVTRTENTMRGDSIFAVNARKVLCKRGHPLSGDNLEMREDGSRRCRKCVNIRARLNYWKRKGSQ